MKELKYISEGKTTNTFTCPTWVKLVENDFYDGYPEVIAVGRLVTNDSVSADSVSFGFSRNFFTLEQELAELISC